MAFNFALYNFIVIMCTGPMSTFLHKKSYCDFVLWTQQDIHTERIYPDEIFWLEQLTVVKQFYTVAILPELLEKFYSHTRSLNDTSKTTHIQDSSQLEQTSITAVSPTFCYCQGPDEGPMVGCDDTSCPYEWFHLACLGLKSAPKSKHWYCPDCRQANAHRKKRKK